VRKYLGEFIRIPESWTEVVVVVVAAEPAGSAVVD
jgi:hypothetical protein